MAKTTADARRRCCWSFKKSVLILLIAVAILTSILPYFVSVQDVGGGSSTFDSWLPQAQQQQEEHLVEHRVGLESNIATDIDDSLQEETTHPDYHIVFSTSCTAQQHWESYVFFYHCRRVKQPGTVTRIASGCNEEEAEALQKFHDTYIEPMAVPQQQQTFELHLTPDYSRVRLSEGKNAYKYMNKPYGLRHWMEHSILKLGWTADNRTITSPYYDATSQQKDHQDVLDGIVILMDPDMILLKQIGHDFSNEHELWVEGKKPAVTKVTHGHPFAQQDGYLSNEWMRLDFSYITGSDSVKPPPDKDGPVHWNTGPPYLATVSDMYKIVSLWTETAPRVLDVYPQLFAEMYGFIIATVMLKLPFSLTKSIVISTTATAREGWPLIDALSDSDACRVSVAATSTSGSSSSTHLPVLPIGLHYCKRYSLGKWFFSKYRVKKNIMDCNKNLFMPPPEDVFPTLDYMAFPPRADLKDAKTFKEERIPVSAKFAKREAFMLCGLISAINEALRYYKLQACGKDGLLAANLNETYTIYDDPTNH